MTKTNQQKVKDFLINNGVIIVMFILVIYTGFTSDNFFTKNNFMNILMNMSSRLVIALGIAGCVITAGCDLSAGRMIGFGACISGMLLQRMDYSGKFFPDMQPLNVFVVALIAMLVCAAFGTVTGFFIAYLNVPPFIATLAMMEIVYGIGLIVTNATPLGGYVEQYTWRTDPKIYTMSCPECGAPLKPDDVWLKKGSNSWYTLSQCPHCAGSSNAAGKGVFQRYKLARRDGLHWSYARCLQIPDDASLARWEKQRTAQLERMKARAEKQTAE